jgi:hypothetical protein
LEVILLLDKPIHLCCLALHFFLELSSIDHEQVFNFAVLVNPPAVIGLEIPFLEDEGLLVVCFELLYGGLELSLCLIFYYLCVIKLLEYITLKLLNFCFLLTQQPLSFSFKGFRLLAKLSLMEFLQSGHLGCVP